MTPMYGLPYVPGRAIGRLRFDTHGAPGAVTVLRWPDLEALTGAPEAIIVIEPAPLSHSMIRLFSLGVPVVCVDQVQAVQLVDGARVLLDGDTGLVREPAPTDEPGDGAPSVNHAPLFTADGTAVQLRASVASEAGAACARLRGASAIGLVRGEYLVADTAAPPEAAAYEAALSSVCRAAAPLPVTLRLSDFGPSKRPTWLEPGARLSPLGRQGVRWFEHPKVAKAIEAQLQAVASLASHWPLAVLLPFVTLPEEGARWRDWVTQRLPPSMPVGAMAETPAAVLAIDGLLREMDFVGIGCNDLLQGLFETDRDLPEVRSLLDPYAPSVYRLLHLAAEAAGAHRARVQLCGLLSQLPGVLPVLIGLGYRVFSVEPLLLPWLDQHVRGVDTAWAKALATRVCEAANGTEVRERMGLSPAESWVDVAQ